MTFYFYRSHVNADGQRVYKNAAGQEVLAGNGYYDPRDGCIHIDLIRRTIDAFRGVHPESPEGRIVERMTEIHAQLQQAFAEGLHEGGENYHTGGQKNTAQTGGVKYAANYDYTKSFAEQIDDYRAGRIPQGDTLLLGGTPKIYQSLGFNALPMTMNTTHVDYALYGTKDADHFMGEVALKQLPKSLENPVAVFLSQTHGTTSVVALLNFTVNGKQTVAPIVIDGYGKTNSVVIDSNAVTSAYGKTSAINQLYRAAREQAKGNFALLYANKKEALSLLQRAGHQLSGTLIPHDGFYHSIREKASPVKPKFNDVTETQQFRKWFGDWLKHPKTASKIINNDGTPKIMYHGTSDRNGDFYTFDASKAKKRGGLGLRAMGKGNYFTAKRLDGTERYGSRIIPAYLNIRNPFIFPGGVDFHTYACEQLGIQKGISSDELQQEMRDRKYDGVIQYDKAGEVSLAVAFDSEQIKSATDNIGTFDGSNPDIRYSARYQQNASAAQLLREENAGMTDDVAGLTPLAQALRKMNGGKMRTAYLAML